MFKYHISFICTQIATKSLIFFSAEVTCYFVCSFICPIITTDSSNFSLCELYDFPPTHAHPTMWIIKSEIFQEPLIGTN